MAAGFPSPGPELDAEFVIWPADREIFRIHKEKYASNQFNDSKIGDARFSPIASAGGKPIPILYGGETIACALMETVFHDVPHTPGFKSYDKHNLEGALASVLSPARDLQLVSLSAKALRKLGITRARLLDSDAADYPYTRSWARALHAQFPDADGLRWVSRQDDEAHALVLFGDRVKKNVLRIVYPSTNILNDFKTYRQLLELAQLIGVDIL